MGPLTTLLIGHRGTGKTSLLRAFQSRFPEWRVYDLDEEIVHSTGETVEAIFTRSEAEFRNHERRVLTDLLASCPDKTVIALGAGFEGPLPEGVRVVWIRRVTDGHGRVFAGRPRLNARVSLFDEYMERFELRERRYRLWAHEVLTLPEGGIEGLEEFLIPDAGFQVHGDLTLLPENFRAWSAFWRKRKNWGLRFFELRDDLLRPDQIETALRDLPRGQVLFSVREGEMWPKGLKCDWPHELGAPPEPVHVLSLHARDENFETILKTFGTGPAEIHKLSIEIRDFHELKRAHAWWLQDPSRRAFLPRSPQGRWRWYRSLFGPRMPLHFIREGDGSSLDQPYLWQARLQPPLHNHFAAVLGRPVDHSLSPLQHREFFKETPFVSIEVKEEEFSEALEVLTQMGLKYAAVTAPLKKAAALSCAELSPVASDLRSVNTLFHNGEGWIGHNTDYPALEQIRSELPPLNSVWLWGGGGIKSSVKRAWPEAREISARAGTTAETSPDLLIWATGRSREFRWPPPSIRPQLVLDLNYGDDSPGLEWAVRNGLPYQSGLRMFKLQAEAQAAFWSAQGKDL